MHDTVDYSDPSPTQGVGRAPLRSTWRRVAGIAAGAVLLAGGWWLTHPASLTDSGGIVGMGPDGSDPAFFGAPEIVSERFSIHEIVTHVAGSAEFSIVACPMDAAFYGAVAADEELLAECRPPDGVSVAPPGVESDDAKTLGVVGHATAPEGGALCMVDVRYDNGLQRGWQRGIVVARVMGPGTYEEWCGPRA